MGIVIAAINYMRYHYVFDLTAEKTKFQIMFSKTKRGLQKLSLFGLTVWYIPSTRTMLETFGYEFDSNQLETRQCYGEERVQFGEPCCLKTFQNETCSWFQSDVATPLQITSIPFLLTRVCIVSRGMPELFTKG